MNDGGQALFTHVSTEFCDWHLFHYRHRSRIVIVNQLPRWAGPTPVVTWLDLYIDDDSDEHLDAAVMFAGTLARAARDSDDGFFAIWTTAEPRESNAPGHLYLHHADGTVTSRPIEPS